MNAITLLLCIAAADAGVGTSALLDAGTADGGAADAGVEAPEIVEVEALEIADGGPPVAPGASLDLAPVFPAHINEQPSPLGFRLPLGAKDARTRAREAGEAMASALAAGLPDAPLVQIVVDGSAAFVKVRGRAVATLSEADARADGAAGLAVWAPELETRLLAFVRAEDRRHSAQGVALRLFVSIALALLAILTIRVLRSAFLRLEQGLEEQESTPTPLKLFGVALLSGEALRAVTLVVLVVGRVLSYTVVVAVALLSAFSQFDVTRPWIGRIMGWALSPLVNGVDVAVRGLPGLVLAGVLVLGAAAAVRLVRLLLDDIQSGRVESRFEKARTRPARAGLTVVIVLVAAPLVIGAAFLRFGTPLETLALLASGAVALAAVPLLASAVVGGAILWRSRIRIGDWVRVGSAEGEVAAVELLDVTIVPTEGGTIVVPMVALAVLPMARQSRVPQVEVLLRCKRVAPLAEIDTRLLAVVRAVDKAATVEWTAVGSDHADATIRVPHTRAEARSSVVRAVAAAAEKGELTLAER